MLAAWRHRDYFHGTGSSRCHQDLATTYKAGEIIIALARCWTGNGAGRYSSGAQYVVSPVTMWTPSVYVIAIRSDHGGAQTIKEIVEAMECGR